MKYVAVVSREGTDVSSGNGGGAWSAYVGDSKDEVIGRALQHAKGSTNRGRYEYSVYVGQLTEEAVPKAEYVLRGL